MFKVILQKIKRNNLGQNKDNISIFFSKGLWKELDVASKLKDEAVVENTIKIVQLTEMRKQLS